MGRLVDHPDAQRRPDLQALVQFPALLFGPIHYICMDMWRKAITLSALILFGGSGAGQAPRRD
jgi:hypothetical protein